MLLVAAWLFTFTHVDTFVVLTAFCADEDYRLGEVLIGHVAGFSLGITAAVVGAFAAAGLLQEWTYLLGVVPLTLGVWGLLRTHPDAELPETPEIPEPVSNVGVVTMAGVGLSGENVAVYVPFFAGLTKVELAAVVALYVVAAGVVFLLAAGVVRLLPDARTPAWVDDWLVPVVLVAVGVYVLSVGWLL